MKNILKNYSPSVLFWNGLFLLLMAGLAIFWLDGFWVLQGAASFVAIGVFMDAAYRDVDHHLWVYFTITFWVIITIIGVCQFFGCLVGAFNNWLNNLFKKNKKRNHGYKK
jgi:hypothetical protein